MTNALPSLSDVAAQFAGTPILNQSLTKEAKPAAAEVPAESTATPPPGPAIPSAEAEPTGEAREAAVAALAEPEAPKDPMSAKFAALSRREKAHQQATQKAQTDLKAAEQRIKDTEARLEARLREVEERDQKITGAKTPLELLQSRGFSYMDATTQQLGGWKAPEVDPLAEKLKPFEERLSKVDALEKQLDEYKQQLAQKEQQTNFQTVNNSIKETVKSNVEKYEYVSQFGEQAVDLIRDVMVESYSSTGQMLSYEAACDQVEEYYEDEIVKKLLTTNKVKSRFASPATAPKPPQSAPATPPSKTLTAAMTTAGAATIDVDKLSPRDAIAYLSKQLKYI
jgi:hypothetical protein